MEWQNGEAEKLVYLLFIGKIYFIQGIEYNDEKGFFRMAYETGPGGMYSIPEKHFTTSQLILEVKNEINRKYYIEYLEKHVDVFETKEYKTWVELNL